MTFGLSSRLALSDTDSLLICSARPMSTFEHWQHSLLIQKQTSVLYKNSLIARELGSINFRIWHELLDFSSLAQDSIVFQSFFSPSTALSTMARYLGGATRKKLFKFQSEVNFYDIQHLLSPAIKSYQVQLVADDCRIPVLGQEPLTEETSSFPSLAPRDPLNRLGAGKDCLKKCKGVRRSILRFQTSLADFVLTCKTNTASRRITQYAIRKKQFRLYLTSENKMLLSRIVIKRLTFAELSTLWSFFTFPLCFKRLLKQD